MVYISRLNSTLRTTQTNQMPLTDLACYLNSAWKTASLYSSFSYRFLLSVKYSENLCAKTSFFVIIHAQGELSIIILQFILCKQAIHLRF